MAIIQTNIAEKQTTIQLESKLKTVEFGGRVRTIKDVFTPTSAYASGTVIELARIPKGAKVLPQSEIYFEAGQNASLTVKVGIGEGSATSAVYLPQTTVGSTAKTVQLSGQQLGDYVTTEEGMLTMITGGAALVANKKIGVSLQYVVD